MNSAHSHRGQTRIRSFIAALLAGGCVILLNGCNCACTNAAAASQPSTQAAVPQDTGEPAAGQPVFNTDEEAASVLVDAAKACNHEEVHRLLGPDWKNLVSGDPVEDANAFKEFADRASEHMQLEQTNDSTAILHVGNDDWAFPIPIVKDSEGQWFLDTPAGEQEILCRRIGRNELEAIGVCHAYVQAQREYESEDRDGSGVMKYAQRILSTPGKHDGLYWETDNPQDASPLASQIAKAKVEGYSLQPGKHQPYHGYHFRILAAQGPDAPGGQYSYVINGNMVAGFALVAFPADYGSSGIMTFIVNQSGVVYQKDLGPDTVTLARQMHEYNPDSSWTPVKD
ncbi:MAG TPA: DUF2950 domain-containing protein [Tepidisphaeraceae bacterium]|nr:DUF2950 domain-containing protein [Tepidisphaeraceae bacterium]HUB26423.1 DUF2950 domain-containing protein [Tepidisphaeraceae bacterium]